LSAIFLQDSILVRIGGIEEGKIVGIESVTRMVWRRQLGTMGENFMKLKTLAIKINIEIEILTF
jgi:hypothetical protein